LLLQKWFKFQDVWINKFHIFVHSPCFGSEHANCKASMH
jgi:hypothetical protein